MTIPVFTIQDRMRKAREVAGFDQVELARRLDVTPKTISRWETGTSGVKQMVLRLWAEETHVPVFWLQYGAVEAPYRVPDLGYGQLEVGLRARRDSNPQPSDP